MITLETLRCAGCNTLIARVHLAPGMVLEIKCRRCGTMNRIGMPPLKTVLAQVLTSGVPLV